MAKNIVFVLHGIGEYADGWLEKESSAIPTLREAAKKYPFFEGKSLDSYVEFVPILYDDVYERILKHWADLGEALGNAIPVIPKFAEKTVAALQGATNNKWWLKTGADVLLYWGFKLYQQRIILRVLSQITKKVADSITVGNEVPGFHILAHSLGTAVAHDSLHHLGTEAWLTALKQHPLDDPDGDAAKNERDRYLAALELLRETTGVANPFSPNLFAFESITMISNVSALIHGMESPYQSIVQPGSATEHGAFTRQYLNVNHKFDPISLIGNFEMPQSWELRGGYDIKVDHLLDPGEVDQLHSAAHYVAHPNLNLRLLQFYVDPYSASPSDIDSIRKFENDHGLSQLVDKVKDELKEVKEGKAGKFKGLIEQIKKVKELFDA